MQLNDLEQKKIANTIRRMYKALVFAFPNKSEEFISAYALLTSKNIINRYFDETCKSKDDFVNARKFFIAQLSEYSKMIFSKEFKGVNNGRH